MSDIRAKRVYDPPARADGVRILVDRVWPRGMTKAKARADLWLKDVAPSAELRKWFAHDPAKWDGFKKKYFAELDGRPEAVAVLRDQAAKRSVTLLYSARDDEHNQAVALREYLTRKKKRAARTRKGN